jgi:prevent-host-death family protein
MKGISTADARNQFSDIINRAAYGKERVVLTRRGKELVAVISIEDLELLNELEDRIDLDAAREAMQEGGTIPWEDVKREIREGTTASRGGRKRASSVGSDSSRSAPAKRKRP